LTILLSTHKAAPHAATPAGAVHPAGRTLYGSADVRTGALEATLTVA